LRLFPIDHWQPGFNGTLYMSEDLYAQRIHHRPFETEDAKSCARIVILKLLRRKMNVLDQVRELLGSDLDIGIVEAHGTYLDNQWCFVDGEKRLPIQAWIDAFNQDASKRLGLLLIGACNPKARTLVTTSVPVLYPLSMVSGATHTKLTLALPAQQDSTESHPPSEESERR
jgi:hypothetical protein